MVGIADWLIHREMGCDWLVANMKRFEKIRIYFNGKSTHILSFQLKCSSNIDSIHYLGLTNSFDQVPRDIHTLPSIIVNFLLNSLNAPITFVVCATNQS